MRREAESKVRLRSLLSFGLVAAVVIAWLTWWQWGAIRDAVCGPIEPVIEQPLATAVPEALDAQPESIVSELEDSNSNAATTAAQFWQEQLGEPPTWPDDLTRPARCEQVDEEFEKICRLLDERARLDDRTIPGGTCGSLLQAAENLAARPPAVSSELRSFASMLSNVFHLFRALDRRQIERLRRVMVEDRALAEPVALALFRRAISSERCSRKGEARIELESLYDYSAFLFTTMGGQAYLRRRDPQIESLAAFYALMVLDLADRQGSNPHGVDPRTEIDRTRRLIEGQDLVFTAEYLQQLDEMRARWEARGSTAANR